MKARGYIFSGAFRGQRVPQHIQNMVVREYCIAKGFEFVLSRAEYSFSASGGRMLQLQAALSENYSHLVLYSILQLPCDLEQRFKLYEVCRERGISLHAACEGMTISEGGILDDIELVLQAIDEKLYSVEEPGKVGCYN